MQHNLFDQFFNLNKGISVEESDDAYMIEMELPGVKKDEVQISSENGTLIVKSEGRIKVNRAWSLPSTVDVDTIDATLKDGLLTVLIPKRSEAKTKRIEVKV